MFVALDKLTNQGVRQAIICVPERSIGASFGSEPISQYGFFADWVVAPQWNLCNTPGADDAKVAKPKVKSGRRIPRQRGKGAGLHPRDLPLRF